MEDLTNPEFLKTYSCLMLAVLACPMCHECNISPERRKVSVGSTAPGSVKDEQRKYLIL